MILIIAAIHCDSSNNDNANAITTNPNPNTNTSPPFIRRHPDGGSEKQEPTNGSLKNHF